MAIAALKIKVMPESPNINLDEVQKEAEKKISELGANLHTSEVQDIAFGIKALVLTIAWPEEKEQDAIENALSSIVGVKSAEVIDFRRAIG